MTGSRNSGLSGHPPLLTGLVRSALCPPRPQPGTRADEETLKLGVARVDAGKLCTLYKAKVLPDSQPPSPTYRPDDPVTRGCPLFVQSLQEPS